MQEVEASMRPYKASVWWMSTSASLWKMCLPPCAHDQLTAAKPVNSQLALDGEAQARALSDPDQEGWNLNSVVGHAFWLRVSVIRIKFREEILELSLGAKHS